MFNLLNIFESIEHFAYNILIWLLIVPKTMGKIIINPGWVPEYITKEIKEKESNRFDDYFSPVILSLLVSVVPFIYFYYIARLPAAGLDMPQAARVEEEVLMFGNTNFISETPPYDFTWWADEVEPFTVTEYEYPYSSASFYWETSGYKYVALEVTNGKGELISDSEYIYIGEADEDISGLAGYSYADLGTSAGTEEFTNNLTSTGAALPALIFLGVPLLFALAVEAFRGNPLSGQSLMRSFYIQCYYFTPIYLVMWAATTAPNFFLTPAEHLILNAAQIIGVYFVLWLIVNETRLIAAERGIHWGLGLLITLLCVALVILPFFVIDFVESQMENTRLALWVIYGAIMVGLIVTSWIRALMLRLWKKN